MLIVQRAQSREDENRNRYLVNMHFLRKIGARESRVSGCADGKATFPGPFARGPESRRNVDVQGSPTPPDPRPTCYEHFGAFLGEGRFSGVSGKIVGKLPHMSGVVAGSCGLCQFSRGQQLRAMSCCLLGNIFLVDLVGVKGNGDFGVFLLLLIRFLKFHFLIISCVG